MIAPDPALGKRIGALLKAPNYTSFLDFAAGGGRYRPADYAYIGTLLIEGQITVQVDNDPKYKGVAMYETKDVLTVSHYQGKVALFGALVIHEATHAIQDKAKLKLPKLEAEVGCFIAQGTFLAKLGIKAADEYSGEDLTILSEAVALGHKVLKREKVGTATGKLKQAIVGHSKYTTVKSETFDGDG